MNPNKNTLLLRLLPFLILFLASVTLWLNWDRIPAVWAIHWGIDGEPNGWASKTFLGVFTPILIGIGLCILFDVLTILIPMMTKRSIEKYKLSREVFNKLNDANAMFMRLVVLSLSIVFATIALWMPLFPKIRPFYVVTPLILLVFSSIVLGAFQVSRTFRLLKQTNKMKKLVGWNGLFYKNPADERLWVPKLFGNGYTLNFAHRFAWLALILLIMIPIILVVSAFLIFHFIAR